MDGQYGSAVLNSGRNKDLEGIFVVFCAVVAAKLFERLVVGPDCSQGTPTALHQNQNEGDLN